MRIARKPTYSCLRTSLVPRTLNLGLLFAEKCLNTNGICPQVFWLMSQGQGSFPLEIFIKFPIKIDDNLKEIFHVGE